MGKSKRELGILFKNINPPFSNTFVNGCERFLQ